MKNIYAYTSATPPGGYYPTYISINESNAQPNSIEVSVRSADASDAGIITLTLAQAADLADKLRAYVDSQRSLGGYYTINTVPYAILSAPLILSYEDICRFAGINPDRNPSCMVSGKNVGKIITKKGNSIIVTDGMHINCMVTGNA